jgi:HD-like signal output (HDOD) protein
MGNAERHKERLFALAVQAGLRLASKETRKPAEILRRESMRTLKLNEISAGQVVACDVSNLQGVVILSAGTVLGHRDTALLRAWGISNIPVEDAPIVMGDSSENGGTSTTPVAPDVAQDDKGDKGDKSDKSDKDEKEPPHPALAELAAIAARVAARSGQAVKSDLFGPPEKQMATRDTNRATTTPVSAQTVAGRAGTLASLPSVYSRVERAINNPFTSVPDIANILRSDQALIARLLRIANSAFYGFPRRVESVDDAVRIIGTRQLHDLVLATVVLTQFKGVDANLVSMPSFWRHSFACGIAARSIATLRKEANTERFFVAGLLHDIGSLVLYQQLADRARNALERHRTTEQGLEEAERSIIGCDHGAVGAALMTSWRLPEFYKEAAASHHAAGGRPYTTGTAVIHVADLLVLALNLGNNGEVRLPRFNVEAWNLLGLPPAILGQIADEVLAMVAETERLFLDEDVAA